MTKIISEETQKEITAPDLTAGELRECLWAPPEAYATIDNVRKFALNDSDYETVQIYHVWTDDEKKAREAAKEAAGRADMVAALPDAVAELSAAVSAQAGDSATLSDAVAELSQLVSDLAEKNK